MPNFRYRALTQGGDVVSGSISAGSAAEVSRRMDYLRLAPIDAIAEEAPSSISRSTFTLGRRCRPEDVTIFTLDLALLLKSGARLDEALELLSTDIGIGRLHPTISALRSSVLAGDCFADALARHPLQFSPIYVAIVRVGETSGALDQMLQMLGRERTRSEALRRKLADALRYPAFLLFAAAAVLVFFLMFVLPQFSVVLRDFGAEINPTAKLLMRFSDLAVANKDKLGLGVTLLLAALLLAIRQAKWRVAAISWGTRLPLIRTAAAFHRAALFCRNLAVLLAAGVPLTATLGILADIMATQGNRAIWDRVMERVRHGGKLSDALGEQNALPRAAVRMLQLGEETGQLPLLAERVAEFYETKLQRSVERAVGLAGPLAIVTISVIIGGLIVSVMTSLLSVSQLVG